MSATVADPITDYLRASQQRALVLDGGFGTELARVSDAHSKLLSQDDLWSARVLADDPDAVLRVHRAYLQAGRVPPAWLTFRLPIVSDVRRMQGRMLPPQPPIRWPPLSLWCRTGPGPSSYSGCYPGLLRQL